MRPRPVLRSYWWRRVRRPVPYWVLAAALAALTGLVVSGLVGRAASSAAKYGGERTAIVARHDLPAGHAITSADVERTRVPAAFLPDGALRDPPVGRVTSAPVVAGEVLVGARLGRAGAGKVAALLPPGTRGVAVSTGDARPPLEVGDHVDLLAAFDPAAAGAGEPSFAVATGALVVDVDDDAVTVAVPAGDAPRVAFALAQGLVTPALNADPPPR